MLSVYIPSSMHATTKLRLLSRLTVFATLLRVAITNLGSQALPGLMSMLNTIRARELMRLILTGKG